MRQGGSVAKVLLENPPPLWWLESSLLWMVQHFLNPGVSQGQSHAHSSTLWWGHNFHNCPVYLACHWVVYGEIIERFVDHKAWFDWCNVLNYLVVTEVCPLSSLNNLGKPFLEIYGKVEWNGVPRVKQRYTKECIETKGVSKWKEKSTTRSLS